ncbi:MAG TPA: hypothetical protein VIJ51_17370 [Solirubrobacteraceae bacterium]
MPPAPETVTEPLIFDPQIVTAAGGELASPTTDDAVTLPTT